MSKLYDYDIKCNITRLFTGIIISIITSLIVETIAYVQPIFYINDLSTKAGLSFSAIVVLALFSGTILSFAKFSNQQSKFGFTANERLLFFSRAKICKLEFNLLEILLVNYFLIPITLFALIFDMNNMAITLLILSIILTALELFLSSKVISDDTESIDNNCKDLLLQEAKSGNLKHVKIMFDSFYDKINDLFIFDKQDEYVFFTNDLLQKKLDAKNYDMYSIDVQILLANLMKNRKLSWTRIHKIAHELIILDKWKNINSIIIYVDDAILELAQNDTGDINDLLYILIKLSNKFANNYTFEINMLAENIWKVFLCLEKNTSMSNHVKVENINSLEEKFINYAVLEESLIVFEDIDTDFYNKYSEDLISYHQYLFLQIVRHYVYAKNKALINILHNLCSKSGHLKNDNSNMLSFLLIIKVSYYFFSLSISPNTSDDIKCFIEQVINSNGSGKKNETFVKSNQSMMAKKNPLPIRKDTIYDYFYSNHMEDSEDNFVRFLICLSILKEFDIDYSSLTNIEVKIAYDMFNQGGDLNNENKEYLSKIAGYFGIKTKNPRHTKVFKDIVCEGLKYPEYFNPQPIDEDLKIRITQLEKEYYLEDSTY